MKFGNRSVEPKPRGGEVSGFFGEGIEIRGDLRFKETVRIDGTVHATIRSDGELVLGPSGKIEGEITVGALTVSGRVKGTIRVKERLGVHPGGRIEGEVLLGRPGLIVHDGGVIEAQIQMGTAKQAAAPSPGAAQQPEKRAAIAQGTV